MPNHTRAPQQPARPATGSQAGKQESAPGRTPSGMDGLFAKIDAISVPLQQTTIPQADREALEALHAQYKTEEAELLAAEAALRNIPISHPSLKYDYDRLIRETATFRKNSREHHIQKLVDHFATTYHLDLKARPTDMRELQQHPDDELIDAVCAWVLRVLGGKTFQQLADDQLMSDARKHLPRAKMSGRFLTFKYGTSSTKIALLAHAAHHFEQPGARAGERLLDELRHYGSSYYNRAAGTPIETHLKRCLTFTPYKNHNLKVKFASESDARAFMTLYGIEAEP